MRTQHPLMKLPIRLCAETLAREVAALPQSAWLAHPQGFDGNIAVSLVSPGGTVSDDWVGPMAPTDALRACPYILEIMQELDAPWGRSRLMGLEAGAVVPEHVDIHYYWRTHLRIHIPVITNPQVGFTCAGETIHMHAGECWLLDSFFRHSVANRGSETRIHLVLDTVGSGRLWDIIDQAERGDAEARFLAPGSTAVRSLEFEQVNVPVVMSPWEIRCHIDYLRGWMDEEPRLDAILHVLDRFVMAWNGTWVRYGPTREGLPRYQQHLADVKSALAAIGGPPVMMRNGWPLLDSLNNFVFGNALLGAQLKERQAAAAAGQPSRLRKTA